ncbi:MAG: outer membrane lipoprotein-sorting protein [Salinisphaeraceae bacterium]|nr:outer membrane lipoprotein-sorting protein [Salinisphaeraceae bacterium]
MRLIALSVCLMLGVGTSAAAEEAPQRSAEDIRECSRSNFPDSTAEQSFRLKTVDASGTETSQRGKMRWRMTDKDLTETNICFTAPAALNGACYLMIEREDTDDIFVFLPSLNRVKRVLGGATSQKLLGTEISYADIKHLQGLAAGGELKRLDDGVLNERPVYMLEGRPDPSQESPYVRVVSHVDQETCTPLQVDLYGLGDKLRKRLHVRRESLQQRDGRWLIHDLTVRDVLNETRTEMQFEDIVYDDKIASRVFNRRTFYMSP